MKKVTDSKIQLNSFSQDILTKELRERDYIYGFFNRADVELIKATGGKILYMPKPKKLGKVVIEREILHMHPELRGLEDDELLKKAATIFPSKEVLLCAMVNAIVESEEGRANTVPTKVGTWTLGFCVDEDGVLCTLNCSWDSDGWFVNCSPVGLGRQWDAEGLLFLATES